MPTDMTDDRAPYLDDIDDEDLTPTCSTAGYVHCEHVAQIRLANAHRGAEEIKRLVDLGTLPQSSLYGANAEVEAARYALGLVHATLVGEQPTADTLRVVGIPDGPRPEPFIAALDVAGIFAADWRHRSDAPGFEIHLPAGSFGDKDLVFVSVCWAADGWSVVSMAYWKSSVEAPLGVAADATPEVVAGAVQRFLASAPKVQS